MEKPAACRVCGAELEQSSTGRPRRYCGEVCRRSAEYELRRVSALLLEAERKEVRARYQAVLGVINTKVRKFWLAEVERLSARLRDLLDIIDKET